jgi:hypothetical protein
MKNKTFIAAIIFGLPSMAIAAPVTFNTALPVSKGEVIVRGQFIYSAASGSGAELDRQQIVIAGGYGINSKLALFAVVPVGQQKLQSFTESRQSSGVGDSRVFARYTLLQRDQLGSTFRIAPFVGVKLPTGENNIVDATGILPAALQTGTGSIDGFGGIVATFANTKWQSDSQISYQLNGSNSGLQIGDALRIETSLQMRLHDRALGGQNPAYLYAVLESGYTTIDKTRINGVAITASGGRSAYIAPAIQLATKRWIAEISVKVPLWQDVPVTGITPDFQTRIGLRVNY